MASEIFYPSVNTDDGVRYGATDFLNSYSIFVIGATATEPWKFFIRFVDADIPIGSNIINAFIRFESSTARSVNDCNEELSFNDVDDAAAPTTYQEFDNLVHTTANVSWNNIENWSSDVKYDTINISAALQEVIDRPGWTPGNAVMIIGDGTGSSSGAFRTAYSFDHATGSAPELHVEWGESTEIELTEQLSLETSIQSDVEITIPSAQLSSETSISAGSPFLGVLVDCPFPLTGTIYLQSDAKISIPSISLNAQSEILSNAQINIPSITLTTTSSISVGEILQAYLVDCPLPFSAQANLQSSLQIGVTQSSFNSTGSLYVQPEIQLFAESLLATGSISAIITDPFSVAILSRVYTFTLTGAADGIDDIVIPIKSFQSGLKSGDPTYLSVVIPGTDYASAINLRLNGDLVVRMGYLSGGQIILSEIISIVDFENIIIYDGTTNKTITLDGHRTETFIPKEINLTGSSYKNLTAGKLRYRCTPNLYVRPGDTVNIDDDSFTIENITYSVSPELETFEVSE